MTYWIDKVDKQTKDKAKAILTSRINVYDDKCVFRSAITSDRISKCIKSLEDELIYYENGDVSTENSRLSCQVVLKKKHDGLIVRVP